MPHTTKAGRGGEVHVPAMKSGATPGQATVPVGRDTPAPIQDEQFSCDTTPCVHKAMTGERCKGKCLNPRDCAGTPDAAD